MVTTTTLIRWTQDEDRFSGSGEKKYLKQKKKLTMQLIAKGSFVHFRRRRFFPLSFHTAIYLSYSGLS
jgi:hypothetical protein